MNVIVTLRTESRPIMFDRESFLGLASACPYPPFVGPIGVTGILPEKPAASTTSRLNEKGGGAEHD